MLRHRPAVVLVASGATCLVGYGARTIATYAGLVPKGWGGAIHLFILLLTSAATLLLGFSLWRADPDAVTRDDSRRASYFAIAFGLVCVLAVPFGTDLWFYIAEGRLAASGADVYTQDLTPESKSGLPIVSPQATMMYGPAWVWISKQLSTFAGRRLAMEVALYKGLMAAAWLINLWLVYRTLGRASPRHQALAVVIVGWLPLSLVMSVAEAHNDILMLALVTGWMVSRRPSGGWLLVASALIKFASLPIVAIGAVDAVMRRSVRSILVLAAAGLVAGVLVASLWNDGALIAGVRIAMRYPRFSPMALLQIVVGQTHIPPIVGTAIGVGWRVLLGAFVVWYGWRHARQPSWTSLCALVGAATLATLLSANSLWPWYVVWILPSLALTLDSVLLKLALPLIVLMPFAQIVYLWQYLPNSIVTALLYVGVSACWLLTFTFNRANRTP